METVSPLLPTLRINKLRFSQGSSSQGHSFHQGQILQGQITEKNGSQFILDVGDQQFAAESRIPLPVGRRLNLEVTELRPQVTLRILTDPLTRNIGKSLHLLSNEGDFLSRTAELAGKIPGESISTSSQQALQLFSNLSSTRAHKTIIPPGTGQKMTLLAGQILFSSNPSSQREFPEELQNIIRQLDNILPRDHPGRASIENINAILKGTDRNGDIGQQLFPTAGKTVLENSQLKELFQEIKNIDNQSLPSGSGEGLLPAFIQGLIMEKDALPPLLFELSNLSKEILDQENKQQIKFLTGRDLQKFAEHLGTNMEQLLATGNEKDARQTLKSALLEISHAFSENPPLHAQAEQLASTIQLYQMLQIRLASDGLMFFPLPFSFFQQGYLLVEADTPQQDTDPAAERNTKNYSLHLKLEGLGNLQIDLQQQQNRGLRIRFYAEDNTKSKFLSDNREELEQWLTTARLESVQFLTGARDPARQLLARLSPDPASVLDTRA